MFSSAGVSHPRPRPSSGVWLWVLGGPLLVAVLVVSVLALRAPPPAPSPTFYVETDGPTDVFEVGDGEALGNAPNEFVKVLTVDNTANVQVLYSSTYVHTVARCSNTSTGVALYIVESGDANTTDGKGPYCDTCSHGIELPPLGNAYLRTSAGTASVSCMFDDGFGAASVPSSGVSGITVGAADARFLKLDASNDPLTGQLSLDAKFDQNAQAITSGTLSLHNFEASTTQAGAMIGEKWDFATNYTHATGTSTIGQVTTFGALSNTSGTLAATAYQASITSLANSTAGSAQWTGFDARLPAMTQGGGGSAEARGFLAITDTITTEGMMYGYAVDAAGVGAGTLAAFRADSITGGAGNERFLQVGSGWDCVLYVNATCILDGTGALAATSNAFIQSGNSFGATATLGTNDNNALAFETNGTTRWTLAAAGHITPEVDDTYDIGDNTHRVRDLYLGPGTMHLGTATGDEVTFSYDTGTNQLDVTMEAGAGTTINLDGETVAASGIFTAGTGGVFRVGADGDLDKIKNAAYSWPADNGDSGECLKLSDNNGTLDWGACTGGGVIDGTVGANQLVVGVDADTVGSSAELTYDGTTFTLAPAGADNVMNITGGTLTALKELVNATATLSTSASYQVPVYFGITSVAGSNGTQAAFAAQILAGYNGSGITLGADIYNNAASTGTYDPRTGSGVTGANLGAWVEAVGSGAGTNIGNFSRAHTGALSVGFVGISGNDSISENGYRSNSTNIGVVGAVTLTKNSGSTTEKHVGGEFHASGGDTNVGLWAGLTAAAPTYTGAAAIFDNGSTTSPIIVGRDNGTAVFQVLNSGLTSINAAATGTVLTVAGASTSTDVVFDVGTQNPSATNGIVRIDYDSATTQTGTIVGQKIDLSTNLTVAAAGGDLRGIALTVPGSTVTSGTSEIFGLTFSSTTPWTANGGGIDWRGTSFTLPGITGTSGTVTSRAHHVILGDTTTSGTQIGYDVQANAGAAATGTTHIGFRAMDGNKQAGDEYAFQAGKDWDAAFHTVLKTTTAETATYFGLAAYAAANVANKPTCTSTANLGRVIVLEDTDDSAKGDVCVCVNSDDTTWAWKSLLYDDGAGNPSTCSE